MRITRWPPHLTTPRSHAETSNTTSADATPADPSAESHSKRRRHCWGYSSWRICGHGWRSKIGRRSRIAGRQAQLGSAENSACLAAHDDARERTDLRDSMIVRWVQAPGRLLRWSLSSKRADSITLRSNSPLALRPHTRTAVYVMQSGGIYEHP